MSTQSRPRLPKTPSHEEDTSGLWEARIAQSPQDRAAVLAEIERRNGLFESADCPEELKLAVQRLRSPKGN